MSTPEKSTNIKEVVTTQPLPDDSNIRPPTCSTDDDEITACFKCYGPCCLCLQIFACITEICCVIVCDCIRK